MHLLYYFPGSEQEEVESVVSGGDKSTGAPVEPTRIRIFVDFWNFQLSISDVAGKGFRLDWSRLAAHTVGRVVGLPHIDGSTPHDMEEMRVYVSVNPRSAKDLGLKRWATGFLDRLPGVFVDIVERRHKGPPKCPACYREISPCPHCGQGTSGTVEKGVDTRIVTDMIRLAWSDSYDIGVLASEDRDFIPAVEFLQTKGLKIIQLGSGRKGHELATKCWAALDLSKDLPALERK